MKTTTKILFLLCLVYFVNHQLLFAGVSVNEPVNSDIYKKLDILRANGLIKSQVVGVKPYSHEEVLRLIREAETHVATLKGAASFKSFITETISDLDDRMRIEVNSKTERNKFTIKPIESLKLDFNASNEDYRLVPINNGLGFIRAKNNPLYYFQNGQDYVDGVQYFISARNWAEVTSVASLSFSPRVQFEFPHVDALDQDQFFIDELQANLGFKNIRLSAGRGPLLLGQSNYGGFILSNNVRGLDSLVLSNDHPFRFPWVFKYLGDQKLVAYVATLGPESFFKNTLLAGYKWVMKPHSNLELGLSNVMQIGGDGAPSYGIADFAGDYFGFSSTSNSVSNRIMGFDGRLRLPLLKGVETYFEAFWDDKTIASFKRTLIDTSAYKFGFFIPKITHDGRLSATFETKFISELFYRHGQFQSGYTMNSEILGDAWGPDSYGSTALLDYLLNDRINLKFGFGFMSSGEDAYLNTGSAITKLTNLKREKHFMSDFGFVYDFKKMTSGVHLGYDRVYNAGFTGLNKNNVSFSVDFQKHW